MPNVGAGEKAERAGDEGARLYEDAVALAELAGERLGDGGGAAASWHGTGTRGNVFVLAIGGGIRIGSMELKRVSKEDAQFVAGAMNIAPDGGITLEAAVASVALDDPWAIKTSVILGLSIIMCKLRLSSC